MSLHRRAAKRDANEPTIVSALEALGCVVWRVSGKGLPDLIVLRAGKKWLADVKGPKEKPTPAQEKAWEDAATKARCAVFILRTPEDAAAMLYNALQPWEPEEFVEGRPYFNGKVRKGTLEAAKRHRCGKDGCRKLRPCPEHNPLHRHQLDAMAQTMGLRPRKGDAAKARRGRKVEFNEAMDKVRAERGWPTQSGYTPPRSTPVGAAKEAEATFAAAVCCDTFRMLGRHHWSCTAPR